MSSHPPKFFLRFFRWFCHPRLVKPIEGDLMELYEERLKALGKRKANWKFIKDVLLLFRKDIIKPTDGSYRLNTYGMLKHNFLLSWRYLLRNKKYAFLNLIGLTIGFTTVFILFQHVSYFLNLDLYNQNADHIFEIGQAETMNDKTLPERKRTFFGTGPLVKQHFPEVEGMTRYITNIESLVVFEKQNGEVVKYNETFIAEADPDFPSMFTMEFVHGDPKTALNKPNSAIITSSVAKKYFGEGNAIGKSLKISKPWGVQPSIEITAVVEDIPSNSSFQFGILKSLNPEAEKNWDYPEYRTYLLLQATEGKDLASKISRTLNDVPEIKQKQKEYNVNLIALSENELSTSRQLLLVVGMLTLIVTWVNYVNLSTAKSFARTTQVGILKLHGSNRYQSIYQFTMEGLIIQAIGLSCSSLLIIGFYPLFNIITQTQLEPLEQFTFTRFFITIGLFLLGVFLSSIVSALKLTKANPILLLKKTSVTSKSNRSYANPLLIIQFLASAVLLICFTMIISQMKYLKSQNLGFNADQTIIIKPSKDGWDGGKMVRFNSFKNELRQLSQVEKVYSSTSVPGRGGNGYSLTKLTYSDESVPIALMGITSDYLSSLQLKLLAGDSFRKELFKRNRRSVIINQTAAHRLGYHDYDSIIGQKVSSSRHEQKMEIIGVIQDYHFSSLKDKIGPLMMDFNPFRGFIFVKLNSKTYENYDELHEIVNQLEKKWNQIYTNQVFDFRFLDDEFQSQYSQEIIFSKVFFIFTGISIFISCLGLLGVSMFMIERKKKEVGIRKVLGARVYQILQVFLKKVSIQVLVASIIAVPLAYYGSIKWLQNFSYKIVPSIWMFVLPIISLFILAALTVCLQTFKTAIVNPVESLKDE